MNTRARVIHILSRALRMKRSTDAECGTTAARNSLVCSNQPVVAPKIVVNNKRRNVLSFYHGAMLTICLFAVSNYLWLAASWSSTNIVVRQSSLFDLRGIPSGNHDGDTRILLQKEGNAATEAYISQTIVKIPYTRQRLMANTSNKNSALEDITARVKSPFSSSNPSSSSSLSCARVNDQVLNMGNRTRLGTGEKILLVGLSKAGTTSVGGFFEKAGYNTCDFRCGPKVSNVSRTIGRCMWQAQQERKPLIASCGGEEIEMYAQMDTIGWPRKNFCFFPQIDALKELHSEHPDATLILNMRQVRAFRFILSLRALFSLAMFAFF
jgi:hypothetical protein